MNTYPTAVNLPFNSTVITDCFSPALPGSADPGSPGVWVVIQGGALIVEAEGKELRLPENDLPPEFAGEKKSIYIGKWEGKPVRVMRLPSRVKVPAPYLAEPFNAVADRLDDRLLTLGGLAHQILFWQRHSAHCSRCGSPDMKAISASWGNKCGNCGHEHFPHIHPCVIVLVRRGSRFLLVRKPEWSRGRFGLIAGFVDFGESLEECVRREVREEAGIEVENIRYVGSQCWPFPSQLMAGFVADYAGGDLRADPGELEEARWFCTEDMPESLPARRSIARWIIDTFAPVTQS
ncbi:NAD(+) diphosphatase [Geobacter sp. DSM 9736]|uniref:NAD(+) diphosphatase n=1 Tax=Geobacter sp. DSM 9736 TaxID=1277350 RepID=UPI000B509B1E|nr:NAD(+) diphosphatase [Geobacter sp. DSM 9736]SNB46151.1 NAD+ diphosphatase [Geobacter sp. DSM 9736]